MFYVVDSADIIFLLSHVTCKP